MCIFPGLKKKKSIELFSFFSRHPVLESQNSHRPRKGVGWAGKKREIVDLFNRE